MAEKKVVVNLQTGLHARPAAKFVQEANKFTAEIYIMNGSKKVNAKSIMGIMSIAVSKGTEITIVADGLDEVEAVDALVQLVSLSE